MIEEDEALRQILDTTPRGATELVALADAAGRRAATALIGQVDLPGFDNSAMDGYAVRSGDAKEGAQLVVAGEQPAGRDLALEVQGGEAVRIFTGAPMPVGADAVVMQEDVDRLEEQGGGVCIVVRDAAAAGDFIRRRGGDVCTGQKLFEPGDRISAGRVALLASQGFADVEVFERPRVAVVTTGDELRQPGDVEAAGLLPGEIFNSNAAMLCTLAGRFGAEVTGQLHAADETADLRAKLKLALDSADVVLVAGGVSVGERDLVKQELVDLGVESDFWKVRVKPGKPFLYGRRGEKQVFGLPGNPVSAFTTFLLFAAPALNRRAGELVETLTEYGGPPLPRMRATAAEEILNRGDRPHYVRGRLNGEARFSPVGMQQSHAIFGMSRANAMCRLGAGAKIRTGDAVEVWRLDDV